MNKKILVSTMVLTMVLTTSIALAQEKSEDYKAGITPDSPWYFLDKIGESLGNMFVFNEEKKIERYEKLSKERLAEAKEMIIKNKPELARQSMEKYEKYINNIFEKTTTTTRKRIPLENNTGITNTYTDLSEDQNENEKLIKIVKERIQKFKDLIKNVPENEEEKVKEKFLPKIKLEEEKLKELLLDLQQIPQNPTDTTTPEYEDLPQYTAPEYEKDPKVIEENNTQDTAVMQNNTLEDRGPAKTYNDSQLGVTDTSTNANTPLIRENWQQENDTEALLAPTGNGGKPGMENGSGQVTRPESLGGSNSKLYLCQIECGRNIIENCNDYASDGLFNLLSCQGQCTHYNLFYGCGMEAGCDEPCWQAYNNSCSPDTYDNCIEGCKNQFE